MPSPTPRLYRPGIYPGFELLLSQPKTFAPSSAKRTTVGGEGASADDLATLRRISGLTGTTGEDLWLLRGSQDITVKHGTGNIKTISAGDIVMTSSANTVLHFMYDGTNWVQV